MTKFVIKRPPEPEHEYRVLIQVFEDGELVSSAGTRHKAVNLVRAMGRIDTDVRDQWTHIIQMAHVASENKEK